MPSVKKRKRGRPKGSKNRPANPKIPTPDVVPLQQVIKPVQCPYCLTTDVRVTATTAQVRFYQCNVCGDPDTDPPRATKFKVPRIRPE